MDCGCSVAGQETDGKCNSDRSSRGKVGRRHHLKSPQAGRPRRGSLGRAEVSDEVVRKTSGRYAGGSHFTVEFSSDEPGPEDLRLTLASGGLPIARPENMKNVLSPQSHPPKTFASPR